MKSSTGRRTAETVRLRADQMPSGTASTMVITVATSTRDKVSMASSHCCTETTTARPAKASTPAVRPRSHSARTARIPASSSGAGACSTASRPSYMPETRALMTSKSGPKWSRR